MMDLKTMLQAADLAYAYSDDDKDIIRQMVSDDRAGLILALKTDPLIMATVRIDSTKEME